MKLYRLEADTDKDPVIQWVGTQAETSKVRKEWMAEHGFKRADIETDEVEVPTNKKDLLEFLNANSV